MKGLSTVSRAARLALAASVVSLLAACAPTPPPALPAPPTTAKVAPTPPPPETPDAPFRASAPAKAEGPARPFAPPAVHDLTLKNGMRVVFAPHPVGTVSVALVVKAGQGDVTGARPGALSFLGAMLEQGTKSRSALKLSDDFEAIGAHHDAAFGWDSGTVAVDVLREHLDRALELLVDVAQNPTFPADEIERLRARRLANLQAEKNSPSAMMQNAQAAVLFGRAHPYGHSLSGEATDVKAITAAELVRLHKELFVPSLLTLVVSGGVNEVTLLPALERTFGQMKGATRARGTVPKVPAPTKAQREESRLVIVDKPSAAQSQIAVTQVGVAASVADRDAISVMNAILGGMFSSRINLNLREKHAYTYGARSYFAMRRGTGPFAASAAVVTDKTVPALRELFVELEAMRANEVTDAELSGAKEGLVQTLPARFETARDVVNALADVVVYDWPADEYATRVERISKVTAADVKRVAAQFLSPRAMKVVVVGDRARLASDLEAMHLGAPDLRDAYGNRLPGAAGPEASAAPKTAPAPAAPLVKPRK